MTGVTVNCAVRVTLPYDAEIVADVEADTALVVTVKTVLAAPAGTVTLAGTVAADELLESGTTAPAKPAGMLSDTVACEEEPPTTLVGFKEMDERVAKSAEIFKRAVFLTLPYVAESEAVVLVETTLPVTVKEA
jgi:hypothetical protein